MYITRRHYTVNQYIYIPKLNTCMQWYSLKNKCSNCTFMKEWCWPTRYNYSGKQISWYSIVAIVACRSGLISLSTVSMPIDVAQVGMCYLCTFSIHAAHVLYAYIRFSLVSALRLGSISSILMFWSSVLLLTTYVYKDNPLHLYFCCTCLLLLVYSQFKRSDCIQCLYHSNNVQTYVNMLDDSLTTGDLIDMFY